MTARTRAIIGLAFAAAACLPACGPGDPEIDGDGWVMGNVPGGDNPHPNASAGEGGDEGDDGGEEDDEYWCGAGEALDDGDEIDVVEFTEGTLSPNTSFAGGGGVEVYDYSAGDTEEPTCSLAWTATSTEVTKGCPDCAYGLQIEYSGIEVVTDLDGACAAQGYDPAAIEGRTVEVGFVAGQVWRRLDGTWTGVACVDDDGTTAFWEFVR